MGSLAPRAHSNQHFRYHFPLRRRPSSTSITARRRGGFRGPGPGLGLGLGLGLTRLALPVWVVLCAVTAARTASTAATEVPENPTLQVSAVRATLLCDNASLADCLDSARDMAQEAAAFFSTLSPTSFPAAWPPFSLNVTVVPIPDDGPEALRTLGPAVAGRGGLGGAEDGEGEEGEGGEEEGRVPDVLVAVGGSGAVRAATLAALGVKKPLLGYVHDDLAWEDTHTVSGYS